MNDYGFVGPHLLVSAEFWGGVVVGVVALAGVLAVAGTWASERQGGGPPSARVVRGAGYQNPPMVEVVALAHEPKSRKPAKPRKRARKS